MIEQARQQSEQGKSQQYWASLWRDWTIARRPHLKYFQQALPISQELRNRAEEVTVTVISDLRESASHFATRI